MNEIRIHTFSLILTAIPWPAKHKKNYQKGIKISIPIIWTSSDRVTTLGT